MSEFAKMDVFFMVTTFVVVILGVLIGMILHKVWRILGHVERLGQIFEDEAQRVRGDIAELRSNVRVNGFRMRYIVRFFKGAMREIFRGGDE